MAKMAKMEEEMKSMQKHMAGLVRTILDLKSKVGVLEEKLHVNPNNDVDELVKQQKRVDEAITANTVAILKIDEEINVLSNNVKQKSSMEGKLGTSRKCRHYNRGHCKHKGGCDFFHPKEICKEYLNDKKCDKKDCVDRHPKVCKYWLKSNAGCKRGISCDFLHVTLACNDGKVNSIEKVETHRTFDCENCDFKSESYNIYFEHINVAHEYGDDFEVK